MCEYGSKTHENDSTDKLGWARDGLFCVRNKFSFQDFVEVLCPQFKCHWCGFVLD